MKRPNTTNVDLSYKVEETKEKHILNTTTSRHKAEEVLKARKEMAGTTSIPEYESEIEKSDLEIEGLKILVVEDIVLNQLLMKTMLEDFGFTCDIAGNGKLAIDILQTETYDVILMDIQMPEMNGFKATEHIRKIMNSRVPIIALTADITTINLAKCKTAGMDDYIAKPVNEELLYNKIVGLVKKTSHNKVKLIGQSEITQNPKCIDLNFLLSRTISDPKMLIKIISIYLEQTPLLVNNMKQSLQDKNWDLLYSSAHKMIPSFSIMGINNGYENIAKQVQDYASNQLADESINELVLQLETVCLQACKELEVEHNNLKNTLNSVKNEETKHHKC